MYTLPIVSIEEELSGTIARSHVVGVGGAAAPRDAERFPNGFLQPWCEASNPKRPALVFAPGFLTECSPKSPRALEEWRTPCIALAREWDFAAFGVHWPSGNLTRLLTTSTNPWVMGAAAVSGRLAFRFLTIPLFGLGGIFSSVLSLAFGPSLVKAVKLWKDAVHDADRIGAIANEWPAQLGREIVLAGHSLGGRIALRGAEKAPTGTFLGIIALAPALEATGIDLKIVAPASATAPHVYASTNDGVLNWLFRAAEATREPALGFAGIPNHYKHDFYSVDVSIFMGKKIGHQDYNSILRNLLSGWGRRDDDSEERRD